MAASNAFIATSASFAASSIDGIQDISVSVNGETTDLISDGESGVEAVFTDADAADITITATNIAAVNTFSRGTVGSLSMTFSRRADIGGKGVAGAGHVVGTAAYATLTSIDSSGTTTGTGTVTLTFRCAAPDSGDPISWSVS